MSKKTDNQPNTRLGSAANPDGYIRLTYRHYARLGEQRDAAVAALRDLRNRIVAEKPDCINTTQADQVLAAAEGTLDQ